MRDIFKLLKYIFPYRFKAFFNILFNFISVGFSLFSMAMIIPFLSILFRTNQHVNNLLPWHIGNIRHNIDFFLTYIVENYGAAEALLIMSFIVVVTTSLKALFSFMASYIMAPIVNGVVRDFQTNIYNKILRLPVGFFTNQRKGDIISRMTSDVSEVKFSIISSLDMIFRDPITITFYLVFLFITNYQLTLFAFGVLLISGIFIARLGKSLRRRSLAGQVKMGEIVTVVDETLTGMRIVKAFNAEDKMQAHFKKLNELYYSVLNKIMRKRSLSIPLGEFIGVIVIVNIMYFGGNLVLNSPQTLSSEAYIAYLAVFSQVIGPARSLSNAYYNIQRGLASIQRIEELMQAEETIADAGDAENISGFNNSIVYKNVSFSYSGVEVLRNIKITVEKGKSIALVGQSGSGKTTLVDLIPRFYDIQKGELLIDGKSINKLKIKDLRSLIGIVAQESFLFNDSIYNNIAFGVNSATSDEVTAAAKAANAHDFIMATENGYQTNIGDRGSRLSGGQCQRISIARAILKNPPILILDEATSSLDTESEYLVQEALLRLMKNRTSIIIAHRLSTIKHVDEIYVLHDGEIVESGKHDELLSLNGYYRKLYDLQIF